MYTATEGGHLCVVSGCMKTALQAEIRVQSRKPGVTIPCGLRLGCSLASETTTTPIIGYRVTNDWCMSALRAVEGVRLKCCYLCMCTTRTCSTSGCPESSSRSAQGLGQLEGSAPESPHHWLQENCSSVQAHLHFFIKYIFSSDALS
jgi:hypothetical protein